MLLATIVNIDTVALLIVYAIVVLNVYYYNSCRSSIYSGILFLAVAFLQTWIHKGSICTLQFFLRKLELKLVVSSYTKLFSPKPIYTLFCSIYRLG